MHADTVLLFVYTTLEARLPSLFHRLVSPYLSPFLALAKGVVASVACHCVAYLRAAMMTGTTRRW